MPEVDVVVGRVGRPHGVRGAVSVELRTDEPETRFVDGARLQYVRPEAARSDADRWPSERVLQVEQTRWHQGRLLVTFAGVTERTAVEQLRGGLLVARVDLDVTPDAPGEYYDRQLVGLAVLDAVGTEVGRVTEVVHLPAQDLLAVDLAGSSRLVPFVEALVPEVDLVAGHVRLADVAGLLTDLDD